MAQKDRKAAPTSPVAFPIIAKILRTVPEEIAFYFYYGIGQYTGFKASSLGEFLEHLRSIDISSIEFHSKRGDFENWFLTTLGDATLAGESYGSRSKNGAELRASLVRITEGRLNRLQRFR